jgi:2'-5' RNA ligase
MKDIKDMADVCTALTLVIPNQFHNDINAIRKKYDRAFPRWMPHINFIFPFVTLDKFSEVSSKLEDKLKGFGSFTIDLTEIEYFSKGKNATFHLRPKDATKLRALFDTIAGTLPDVKVKHKEFTPHLTLGQCKKSEVDQKISEVKRALPGGISFTVDRVCLLSRPKDGPFAIHTEINIS